MRAPKEYRRWINRMRSKHGRKNGRVRGCLLDSPEMERKLANSRGLRRQGVTR